MVGAFGRVYIYVISTQRVKDSTQKFVLSYFRSRVPWGGFANLSGATGNQQFTICMQAGEERMLPTASTWLVQLKFEHSNL